MNFKNKIKTLSQYDCWEEDISPLEWINLIKDKKGPHAKCPIYSNKK